MLLQLPTELQRMVVEELRLPRLPIGTRRSLNPDFVESRSALLSLCLTSRRFHELAEPLLYQSVALTRDKQFVPLLHALLVNRNRRTWIRSLACPMCIMEETDTWVSLPQWNRLIAPRKDEEQDERELGALRVAGLKVEHILEQDNWISDDGSELSGCGLRDDEWSFCDQLLAVVVCLTTHLEDILLQVPTDKQGIMGLDNIQAALEEGINADETGVLQMLRSVRLQPTRTIQHPPFRDVLAGGSPGPPPVPDTTFAPQNVQPSHPLQADPGFGMDPLRLCSFEIQNVEEVEFCGDNGVWFMLLKPLHGPWTDDTLPHDLKRFRSLRSLKLLECTTPPSYLSYLLGEAHSLKTLHYTTRHQEWRQRYFCPEYQEYAFKPEDESSTNEALFTVRKTVEDLTLGSVQRRWVQRRWVRDDEEYHDLELIVVLPLFCNLTRLSIDIRWLVPVDLDEDPALVPLSKLLPRSIECVKLKETWTSTDRQAMSQSAEYEKRAMAWVQNALWSLLLDDDGNVGKQSIKLGHLRKVTLVAAPYHPREVWEQNSDEEGEDADMFLAPLLKTDAGIEEMKGIFARHGVEFAIEWV